MKRLLLALTFIAGSAFGNAYYFKTDSSYQNKGKKSYVATQGDFKKRDIYYFEVPFGQWQAGFNSLPPGTASNAVAAIDASMMANKPTDKRNAENYMITFLRDEGYIPGGATSVPAGMENTVFTNLASLIDSAPNAVNINKSSRFHFLKDFLNRVGGTVDGSVWNP